MARSVFADVAQLNAFALTVEDPYRPITHRDFQLNGLGQDDSSSDSSGDWTDTLQSITDIFGKAATTAATVYKTVSGGTPAAGAGTAARPAGATAAKASMFSGSSGLLLVAAAGAALLVLPKLMKR